MSNIRLKSREIAAKGTKIESIRGRNIVMEDWWICSSHSWITVNSPFSSNANARKITSIHFEEPPLGVIMNDYGQCFYFRDRQKKSIITLDYSHDLRPGDILYAHYVQYEEFNPDGDDKVYEELFERDGVNKKSLDKAFKYANHKLHKLINHNYQRATYPSYKECPSMYQHQHLPK